jgi:Secretion system C-terminal sorting domain/CARDB
MRKFLPLITGLFLFAGTKAQTVAITTNPGTSGNIVIAGSNYHVSEMIYLDSEIGAANFTTAGAGISHIDFSCNAIGTGSTTVAAPNFKIYLKDVPAATTTLATGVYSTTGYTLVYSGAYSYPAAGFQGVDLTTPYVRAPGTNLQVLIERTDNVVHTGNVFNASTGNTVAGTAAVTSRRYNAAAAPVSGTTSLTQTNFRPAIQLKRVVANDAGVVMLYTLGKLPIPNGAPRTDSCNVTNQGTNTLININVTLTITGANSFTNTQIIPSLAPGASANVVFAPYTPTVEGNNTYTVSVPSDDNNSNNSQSITQVINKNTWSYAYGTIAAGGVGFNGATGDFVAKFNTNVATSISQVTVNFSAGGQPYQIGIWDATGAGGTPGANLYTTPSQTSAAGVNVIPVSPAVSIPAGNFYVGVKQTGTVNVSFSYQTETPIRAQTFYFTSPGGGTTWTDFAPANSFRFMIEPKLILPVDASVTNISIPSTVTCQGSFETVTVRLNNPGANAIAPGAASVTLKIRGANNYTATVGNTTTIASGAFETLSFAGINLTNGGQNFDTAYVTITGDGDKANDTTKVSYLSASTLNLVTPKTEDAEASLPVVAYVAGLINANAWAIQTGNYSNADQTNPLVPHGGTKFFIFDSYNAATGTTSRLFSNCIQVLNNIASNNCAPKLSFWMSHDNTGGTGLNSLDSLYISISSNQGATWTRLPIGYQRHDASLTLNAAPIWRKETIDLSAYAGQFIQIGFEGVSKFGNAFGLDDIVIGYEGQTNASLSTTANNTIALIKKCTALNWTYYVDPADANKTLFAVEWDPARSGANTAAMANAIPRIQLNPTYFSAEDIPSKRATYTMKRYWDIDLNGSALTGPVNVRFFFDPAEKAAVDAAATAFATANAGVVEPPTWFKTISGAFAGDVAHVTPDAVLNAIALTDANSVNAVTFNSVLYAEFNGITSFSGGTYATGVGPNTPIPVDLLYFNATRNGAANTLAWATAQEINSSKFVVERSSNGGAYTPIGDIAAAGNSTNTRTYSFIDIAPVRGINLYRLRIVDKDNQFRMSWIRQVRNEGLANVSVYPNPVQDKLTVNIQADKAVAGQVIITDVNGKAVYNKAVNMIQGENIIPVDAAALQAGTYFIKVLLEGDMIVRKFNKL